MIRRCVPRCKVPEASRIQHHRSSGRRQAARDQACNLRFHRVDSNGANRKVARLTLETRSTTVSYCLSEVKRMYCSSCGKAVSGGLRYCTRCGTELSAMDRGTSKPSESAQETFVWALAFVTILGVGAVIGLMAVMKEVVHFGNELILGITLLTFLAFLGVDVVIIWLLLRPRRELKARDMKKRATDPISAPLAMIERNEKKQATGPISAPLVMIKRYEKKQATGPISAPFTMMEDIPELFIRTGETELSTNELEEAKPRVLPEPSYNITDHA